MTYRLSGSTMILPRFEPWSIPQVGCNVYLSLRWIIGGGTSLAAQENLELLTQQSTAQRNKIFASGLKNRPRTGWTTTKEFDVSCVSQSVERSYSDQHHLRGSLTKQIKHLYSLNECTQRTPATPTQQILATEVCNSSSSHSSRQHAQPPYSSKCKIPQLESIHDTRPYWTMRLET